jgi:hypothetical protein
VRIGAALERKAISVEKRESSARRRHVVQTKLEGDVVQVLVARVQDARAHLKHLRLVGNGGGVPRADAGAALQEFSRVSALTYCLFKATTGITFENVCLAAGCYSSDRPACPRAQTR